MKANAGGNFDWIAPIYDLLAFIVFGQRLKRAQIAFLSSVPPNASILMVGGGTGWLLEQVLTTCHPKQVLYLETSARMVALASRRMIRHAVVGSVAFRVGDETSLAAEERFDVIMTPFVLDVYSRKTLQNMFIPTLLSRLNVKGLWLATDFITPPRQWQKALLWIMIRFFRLTAHINVRQLADWQQCLLDAGLFLHKREQQVGGMVSTEVWTRP